MLALADRARRAALVTGHYARIERDAEGPLLSRAADPAQGPDVHAVRARPGELDRLRFPLGGLTKPEVREIAARGRLPVAAKPESQDLCFLAGTGRERFLERHGGRRTRPATSSTRRARLGTHHGQRRYTVGQRAGLGRRGRRAAVRARQGRRRATSWWSARARSWRARASSVEDAVAYRDRRARRRGEAPLPLEPPSARGSPARPRDRTGR